MSISRESQIIEAFRALTPAPGSDVDTADVPEVLVARCAELFEVAAGVVLADGDGGLSVPASSSPYCQLFVEFTVAIDSGPSVECARDGEPVGSGDLTAPAAEARWPQFTIGAAQAGFRAVHALPLCAGDQMFGSVTLLDTEPHRLIGSDLRLAQALGETAAIVVGNARALQRAETTVGQLQTALDSRVVIEQAKGVLAAQVGIRPDEAFPVLRRHARNHNRRLTEVARDVIEGTVDLSITAGASRIPEPRRPRQARRTVATGRGPLRTTDDQQGRAAISR